MTLYLRHGQIAVAMDIEIRCQRTEASGQPEEKGYKAKINRYVLSGDLVAGRVAKTIAPDDTIIVAKSWYHLDHLNSTKCVTDEAGEVEVSYVYRAFGEQLRKLGEGDAKYTYGGKELDDGTNLYYFNARYYDATIGRFINVDPVQDGGNWYVYCGNNPLNKQDSTGLRWEMTQAFGSDKYKHNYPWTNGQHPSIDLIWKTPDWDDYRETGNFTIQDDTFGTAIKSLEYGYVDKVADEETWGRNVVTSHLMANENNQIIQYYMRYSHLDSINVEEGGFVNKGIVVGTAGNSGFSHGSHLDISMFFKTKDDALAAGYTEDDWIYDSKDGCYYVPAIDDEEEYNELYEFECINETSEENR